MTRGHTVDDVATFITPTEFRNHPNWPRTKKRRDAVAMSWAAGFEDGAAYQIGNLPPDCDCADVDVFIEHHNPWGPDRWPLTTNDDPGLAALWADGFEHSFPAKAKASDARPAGRSSTPRPDAKGRMPWQRIGTPDEQPGDRDSGSADPHLAAGPRVLVSGPGVLVVEYTCPDCGVTGDAIMRGKALSGEERKPMCLACMVVE